ncbi:hypothetical protein C5167_026069 [Papaver somniferum]|nr:hypothetical protein C5167_026069 [Papaver somniferum]
MQFVIQRAKYRELKGAVVDLSMGGYSDEESQNQLNWCAGGVDQEVLYLEMAGFLLFTVFDLGKIIGTTNAV